MRNHKHDRQFVDNRGRLVTTWRGLTDREAKAITSRHRGSPGTLVKVSRSGDRVTVTLKEVIST